MEMATHPDDEGVVIKLEGPGLAAGRINFRLIAVLADSLTKAVERITLIKFRGTSVHHGPMPREIRELASFDLIGMSPGSVNLHIAPASENLSGRENVGRAFSTLVGGLHEMSQTEGLVPAGFDYGVIEALQPINTLPEQFGIETISLNSFGRERKAARLTRKDLDLFVTFAPPLHEHVERTSLIGRLLVADFKNYKCKIYEAGGNVRQVPFSDSMTHEIRSSLKGWVEASLSDDEVEPHLAALRLLSDDDVDEMSPVRSTPWPRGVLKKMREQGIAARRELDARPVMPSMDFDDE